jgi:predicted TIM-barrel fold metal-dependent hydrolase
MAPSESLRRIWVDTASPSPASLRTNLDAIGAERMLFGTDSPPLTSDLQATVDVVSDLPIAEEQQAQILGANACRLFGLHDAGALPDRDATAVPS